MSKLDAIFAAFGGTPAARACYKRVFGIDLGPVRAPLADLTPDQEQALFEQLVAAGFLPAGGGRSGHAARQGGGEKRSSMRA